MSDKADGPGDGTPLSIGLVSPGWPPELFSNGIVTYVADLADGLRALGHRVTILPLRVALGDGVHDLSHEIDPRGISRRVADWLRYHVAPRGAFERSARRLAAAAIARALPKRGIQVLEMDESFGSVARVRRATRIPVTVRLHGPWFLNGAALGVAQDMEFSRRVAEEGQAIRQAMSVTAPAHDVLERTREHYQLALPNAEVIPNPTRPVPPADRWRPENCDPRMVLFVGRFDRHKGGDLIIKAFSRVLSAIPDAELCFVGPDHGLMDENGQRWDLESVVDAQIPGARGSRQIRLLGQQTRAAVDNLRRRAALTVVCSRYEVFGLAAAESLALGAPTIAAQVGGLSEIIGHGVDGLLHRPGDPVDLAEKIITLLSDRGRAAELGRQGAERCERELEPVAVASRMVAHYRRLLTQHAHGR